MVLITEIFCYRTRCFLQSDIWQAMCSCSSSSCAHRARATVEYLRQVTPEFISSERLYQKPIRDVDQLKQRLVELWYDVQQTVVDAAIGEWRKRLRACVCPEGHNFEHLL